MKKLMLVLSVGMLLSVGLSSCSKCGSCSDQSGLFYDGEFCKGNAIEDALYEAAKAECEANGGTFGK
jgi:hypothetical protein